MLYQSGDGGRRLTEVERHADEHDEAEPGVEVGDEVDDGDDDVGDRGEDAEHDVAAERENYVKKNNNKKIPV